MIIHHHAHSSRVERVVTLLQERSTNGIDHNEPVKGVQRETLKQLCLRGECLVYLFLGSRVAGFLVKDEDEREDGWTPWWPNWSWGTHIFTRSSSARRGRKAIVYSFSTVAGVNPLTRVKRPRHCSRVDQVAATSAPPSSSSSVSHFLPLST